MNKTKRYIFLVVLLLLSNKLIASGLSGQESAVEDTQQPVSRSVSNIRFNIGGIPQSAFQAAMKNRAMNQLDLQELLEIIGGNGISNVGHSMTCSEIIRRVGHGEVPEINAVNAIEEHLARIRGKRPEKIFGGYEFRLATIDEFICFLKDAKSKCAKEVLANAYYVALSHQTFHLRMREGDFSDIGWESYLNGLRDLGLVPKDIKAAAIKVIYIGGILGRLFKIKDVQIAFDYLINVSHYSLASELLGVLHTYSDTQEDKKWVDTGIRRLEDRIGAMH